MTGGRWPVRYPDMLTIIHDAVRIAGFFILLATYVAAAGAVLFLLSHAIQSILEKE